VTTDADLEALFNRLADGLTSEEDERRLAELLRSNPEVRRAYREFMALHSALHWDYAAAALPEPPPPAAVPSPPPARFPRAGWLAAFAAGTLVASAAVAGFFLLRPAPRATEPTGPEQVVARPKSDAPKSDAVAALLVDGVSAEFAPGRGPDGVRFGPGDYELVQGVVHLRFAQGADMVLAAPARIEVADAQHTRLVSGQVRVVAPPTAKGFTVATRAADYVDLGTEFGLRVDPASGASDLYVFDGQVDVTDPRSGAVRSVTGGKSSRSVDGRPADAPPLKEGDFPTPGSIGLKRWEQYEQRMREDRTLLAFFSFQRQGDESVLANAVGGEMGDGRVAGARWTTGRWPGKGALLFDRDTDFAQVTIPGEHQELTVAAWVKVERIDFVLNAILNSDGYEPGGVHMQLNRQGFVRGGVIVEGPFQDTFVGKPVPLGSWVHVASVISARTRTQQIYVNGALARERRWQSDVPLKPGSCRVGNWLPDPRDKTRIRALRGQVDELAVWSRALQKEEVGRLVEAGRPGLLWSKE
jgi:ferric-dicitrate binding protein FerR (iron transport regulator)